VPYWGALFGHSIRANIPAELTDEALLLAYLGLGATELRKIWYYRGRMYQHFSIAKGPNKVRMISAPDDRLKYLQRKIADKLSELYRPRNPVHGFVADRSVKTNALAHLHRRFVVNIDLQDFFPTITQNRVEGLLTSLGMNSRVAEIIARQEAHGDREEGALHLHALRRRHHVLELSATNTAFRGRAAVCRALPPRAARRRSARGVRA